MKKTMKQLIVAMALLLTASQFIAAAERDFYQIQVYRLKDKAQETRVENYLKMAYIPAMHRAGIKSVGVFKPIATDPTAGQQIIVWMPLTALAQLDKIKNTLEKDAVYQTEGADFLNAPFDNVPFQRKESILLKAFPEAPNYFIPKHKSNPSERIYELRSYEGPAENLFRQKVKMFNEGGEIKLFKSLDFNAVFYAEVVSGSTMPNLMYLTTFADMAAHDAHWNAFRDHPEWKRLSALGEYQHTVSHAVILLLNPTDYSDF
ncbi:MAG TPA: NIPSNAP family protein [Prolixibacteraceae bacterium]|jgi:hypothetical protein